MRPTRLLVAAAVALACARGGPAAAGPEDPRDGAGRPSVPAEVVTLGDGSRIEVRHDPFAAVVEVRALPAGVGAPPPVLVAPAIVLGNRRVALEPTGGGAAWRGADPAFSAAPLLASLEATIAGRTSRAPLGAAIETPPAAPAKRAPSPAAPVDPDEATRIGPEGGRLVPLGTGAVQAELLHDVAAGKVTIQLRDRKDGSPVPIAFAPIAFVLLSSGDAERVEFTRAEERAMGRAARWSATSDALKTSPVQALLHLRIADAPYEANLGTLDMRQLDPPIEERIRRHGGRVIVFGEGAFHGEIVHDTAAGTVSIWFLDSRDKTPIPLNDPPIAEVKTGSEVVVIAFDPVRDHLKGPAATTGRTDLWRATHAVFRGSGPLRGRMIAYVADRPYIAPLSPLVGRRGGRVVTLADGVRAELVRDRATGVVTVYVLDAPSAGDFLVDPPEVRFVSGGAPFDLRLVPLEGRPGAYRVTNEGLRAADAAPRVRFRIGERTVEEPFDEETGTPAPGSPADQDAIPGDHDPGSRRSDAPQGAR